MAKPDAAVPKYRQVYQALWRDIRSGRLKQGERLPSEADLVRQFGASRITVGRAVRDLQREGVVERRAGSGTYVRAAATTRGDLSFGLLIPDLGETEIFEPICQGMMASPLAQRHVLVWGSPQGAGGSKGDRALQLCGHYVDRRVSGVFFAPLEFGDGSADVNRRIVEALDAAGIPVVLLDRDIEPFPARSAHDLVGIDNRRAGYAIAAHLLRTGRIRIAFVGLPESAATVDAREAGYREALYAFGRPLDRALVGRVDPSDTQAVDRWRKAANPDAIVCANDRTAGRLMQTLLRLGVDVPSSVAMAGIDDAEFAPMLTVPLTTLRQPAQAIGDAALGAMLDRVARKALAPREILLDCELIVRESCGAAA